MNTTHLMPKLLATLILVIALSSTAGAVDDGNPESDRVIIDLLRPVSLSVITPTPLITAFEEKIQPMSPAYRLPEFKVDSDLMFNLVDPTSLTNVTSLEALWYLTSLNEAGIHIPPDGLRIDITRLANYPNNKKIDRLVIDPTRLESAIEQWQKATKMDFETQFIGNSARLPIKGIELTSVPAWVAAHKICAIAGAGFLEKGDTLYFFPLSSQLGNPPESQSLVTLKFTNTPLVEVIEKLFEQTKGNFILSPDIGDTRRLLISINLDEAPFEMALRSVLRMAGLVYKTDGNIYEILPKEQTTMWSIQPSKVGTTITDATQGLLELPLSATQELNTRTFELKHIGINEVNALMGTIPGPKKYSVVGKKLIVSLNPDPLDQFVELLNQFDVPSAVSNAVSVRATIRITITNEDKTIKQYVASAESAGIEGHEIPLSIITRLPVERQKAAGQKSGTERDVVLGLPFHMDRSGDSALKMTAVVKLGNGTPFATVNANGVIKLTGPFEDSWTGLTQDFEAVVPVSRDSEGVVARGVVQAESGTAEYEVVVTVKNLGPAAVTSIVSPDSNDIIPGSISVGDIQTKVETLRKKLETVIQPRN